MSNQATHQRLGSRFDFHQMSVDIRVLPSADRARGYCALRRGQGLRPFPRTPFSASSILPSLRSGQVSLDEAEHFLHNRDASVATLRWCSGPSRNAVRIPSGISVRLRRNPHIARQSQPATSSHSAVASADGSYDGGRQTKDFSHDIQQCAQHSRQLTHTRKKCLVFPTLVPER